MGRTESAPGRKAAELLSVLPSEWLELSPEAQMNKRFLAGWAIFILSLFCPSILFAVSFQPLSAEHPQNEIALDYGRCGDFKREGYGVADQLEANATYSRTFKQRHVMTVGIGTAWVDIDSPLITRDGETGIHGLVDYLYYFDTSGQWIPYFNSSLHKMSSAHFDRNELTTYIGLSYRVRSNLFFFVGPGIELDYIGVKKEFETFAGRQGDEVYESEVGFAYNVGIFYRYNRLGLYLGNGPANSLGVAVSRSF